MRVDMEFVEWIESWKPFLSINLNKQRISDREATKILTRILKNNRSPYDRDIFLQF